MLTQRTYVRPVAYVSFFMFVLLLIMGASACEMTEPPHSTVDAMLTGPGSNVVEFVPEVHHSDQSMLDYAHAKGYYVQQGNLVTVFYDVEFRNLDPARKVNAIQLVPPVRPLDSGTVFAGIVSSRQSTVENFDSLVSSVELTLEGRADALVTVAGVGSTLSAAHPTLLLGEQEHRWIVGSISYLGQVAGE
jgi:hypothetical protein